MFAIITFVLAVLNTVRARVDLLRIRFQLTTGVCVCFAKETKD